MLKISKVHIHFLITHYKSMVYNFHFSINWFFRLTIIFYHVSVVAGIREFHFLIASVLT